MIFCDTSTVAKLYVPEKESADVRARLESEDQVFASELARAELMGVFHRQLREKKWSKETFSTAIRQFGNDDIGGFWTWLPLESAIVDATAKAYATLPETVFLRTADSLHLFTALHNGFSQIYTYDVHQTAAAGALGLTALKI
jgi:predicted nucleic acid-binding protein